MLNCFCKLATAIILTVQPELFTEPRANRKSVFFLKVVGQIFYAVLFFERETRLIYKLGVFVRTYRKRGTKQVRAQLFRLLRRALEPQSNARPAPRPPLGFVLELVRNAQKLRVTVNFFYGL